MAMSTNQESTLSDGMYTKLIDTDHINDFEEVGSEFRSPDVKHTVSVSSSGLAPPRTGPGLYRLSTACLAVLCAVLLLSLIAISAHYKNLSPSVGGEQKPLFQNGSSAQSQMQSQTVNVTSLTEALSILEREKKSLEGERHGLLAKIKTLEAKLNPPTLTCQADWILFDTSCYYISTRSKNWHDSQQFCKEKGGHLAIIHTAEEQTFLWNQLVRGHWNAYWFGISDEKAEDDWYWVDGTKLVEGFWEQGEPNNHIDEDCGYIVKTEKLERKATSSWYDAPCSMYWPWICEKELH